jgi:hypothetical protein
MLKRSLSHVLGAALLLTVVSVAEAGPPLICHAFETGPAALLQWGRGAGWNSPDPAYDVRRVTADTLRVLTPDAPILARM